MKIFVCVFGQNCELILLDVGDISNSFCGFFFSILVLNYMLLFLLDKSWS